MAPVYQAREYGMYAAKRPAEVPSNIPPGNVHLSCGSKGVNYIGISASNERGSIAVVSPNGEIVFADSNEILFGMGTGWNLHADGTGILADLLGKYCDPGVGAVLALAEPKSLTREANGGHATDSYESVSLKRSAADLGEMSRTQRAAAACSSYKLRQEKDVQFRLAAMVEYELQSLRGWQGIDLQRRNYTHHVSHAAAACFTSPYTEALCAVLDGNADRSSACYLYKSGGLVELNPVCRPKVEGSLGSLYREICDACGFHAMRDEHWRVMSLANYGEVDEEIRQTLAPYVTAEGIGLRATDAEKLSELYQRLEALWRKTGEPIMRAANLATTGQALFEEQLYTLLNNLHAVGMSSNLVFTGGCALNSCANGRITSNTAFRDVYTPCAPSNAGNAIGAALLAYREDNPTASHRPSFQTPFLARDICLKETLELVSGNQCCKIQECNGGVSDRVAALVAEGKIVSWNQGRAEFGPRPLGNRSILADPRRLDVREVIASISGYSRESQRFGLAVLHEYGSEFFQNYQLSPYMEKTLKFRLKTARKIPAVVSGDGSAQVQSVKRDWNPQFYDLIFSYYKITGIPLVVNVGYGTFGRAAMSPIDALRAMFLESKIDAVAVGDLLVTSIYPRADSPLQRGSPCRNVLPD